MSRKYIIVVLFLIALGFSAGAMLNIGWKANVIPISCDSRFPLINPWLRCEETENLQKPEMGPLKKKIEQFIEDEKDKGGISHVSVYFRDLENGPWFGINEREYFTPASLLKVPVMIALLKLSERDPTLLLHTIQFDSLPENAIQDLPTEQSLEVGKEYTVGELLRRMIVYSDNVSKDLLINYIRFVQPEEETLLITYGELGLAYRNPDINELVTVKLYGSLFRILYNASYLSKEMSQRALDLLSQTEFNEGLMSGVPSGTIVAHKFGQRVLLQQLHDCGIVYHPETPYLICIMTRGGTEFSRKNVIRSISGFVYEEMNAR